MRNFLLSLAVITGFIYCFSACYNEPPMVETMPYRSCAALTYATPLCDGVYGWEAGYYDSYGIWIPGRYVGGYIGPSRPVRPGWRGGWRR